MTNTTQIMNDMDRTRDEIRATLGAIGERASVERLVQQYVLPAKTSAGELGRIFADAVRANPLPLGLTAVGLGWLMLGQRSRPIALPPYDERRGVYRSSEAPLGETTSARVDETLRRAGDKVEEAKHRVAETAEALKQRVDETTEHAKQRVGETVEKAKAFAGESVDRVREAAGKGRQWTAETAGRASDTIRRSVDTAYGATRETAAEVGGRVRYAARRPVGYAREHPLALGAVLVLGGATLALLLARRTREDRDEDDLAPAGMPETPYASGTQATDTGELHRNPTEPLTPEEEEPVFAGGDVSAEAAHPAASATEAEREVVATPPMPTEGSGREDDRQKDSIGRGGSSNASGV